MSEPDDELTPLTDPLPEDPADKSKLSRSPYLALGVAALVVSTVFATVAALASTRDEQAAPAPQSEDTVEIPTSETYTTGPVATSVPGSSKDRTPSKDGETTTTSGRSTTTEDATSTGGGGTTTTPGRPTTSRPPTSTSPAPNRSPIADFSFTCDGFTCQFDGTSSTDPDGTIESFSWSFGASTAKASHTFDQAGSFDVTLTVIDDRGKNASQTKAVTVAAPTTTSGN